MVAAASMKHHIQWHRNRSSNAWQAYGESGGRRKAAAAANASRSNVAA